jgi:hypothetical protein
MINPRIKFSLKHLNSLKPKTTTGIINKRVVALFGSFQVFVFLPALRNPIPWSDDWTYIYFVNDPNRSVLHDAIAAGRPILGIVDQFAYQSVFITGNLIFLQLLSLSGLLLLQLALYSQLIKRGFGYPISILTSLALILIPGIQGYVYFLSCFPYSWACLFGYLSYSLVNNSVRNRTAIGYILLTGSFLVYPAGAMFYFLGYFTDFILRFKQEVKFGSNIAHLFSIILKMALCSAVSMLIGRIARSFYGIEQASRIQLVSSLEGFIDKVVWALTRLFVSEFRIFTVSSPSALRAAIEACILISLFVIFILKPFYGLTLNKILNFCLLLAIPLLGAIPNLVIRENQFEFRTLTATFAMSLALWAFFLDQFLRQILVSNKLKNRFATQNINKAIGLFCVSLLLLTVFHVQRDSRNLWVKPSLARDEITRESLQKVKTVNENSICMVIPEQVYAPLKRLGVYSMRSDLVSSWVPEPYMRKQLENFDLDPDRNITVHKNEGDCEPRAILINYIALAGRS